MQYIFLSPHLDDTTLSCGSWIADLVSAGEAVQIVCVMAGDPPSPLPNTPLIQELHARWDVGQSPVAVRRQEERDANHQLGTGKNVVFWELPDCIYRTHQGQALYPDGQAIFGEPHPNDPAYAYLKRQSLPSDAWIVAPAGIGNHADHQIVRNWARQTVPAERLIFYEDYPYAHASNQIETIAQAFNLMPNIKNVSPSAFQAKYHAILCYPSQISTFWRSDDELRVNLRDYMGRMAGDGSLAERYWHHSVIA
jgi:LmbE family N-acetylglucosaminyl deacetylase